MIFPRYLRFLAAGSLTLAALAFAANLFVDPVGFFGFRHDRFYYVLERETKASLARNPKNKILYFASSIGAALDPADIDGVRIANVSARGLLPEEILYILKKHRAQWNTVIIGLDPFSIMYEEVANPTYADYSIKNVVKHGLSVRSLRWSVATLVKGWLGYRPVMTDTGYFIPPWESRGEFGRYNDDKYLGLIERSVSFMKNPPDRIGIFREIRDVPLNGGSRAIVFIQPVNEDVLAAMQKDEQIRDFWKRFKIQLQSVFPDMIDLSESEFSRRENFFPNDVGHYKKLVAKEVMLSVLDPSRADDGATKK